MNDPGDTQNRIGSRVENAGRPPWPVIYPASLQGQPIPPRLWCVPDWVPDKVVTLLSGDGGTGKSLLAMQLATCAAMGVPFLGMDLAPRKVLYLAAEDDAEELHRRQSDICEALDIELGDLEDRLVWRVLSGEETLLAEPDPKTKRMGATPTYTNLHAFCIAEGIQLLIVDTCADTFGGLEIDRQQVTRYVRLLEDIARKTCGAVVLIAHPSVAGLKDGTGISGNTAWRNAVRSVIYLSRDDDEESFGPTTRDRRILERKKGNFAPPDARLELRYDRGFFMLDSAPPDAEPLFNSLYGEVKIMNALKEILRNGMRPSPSKNSPAHWAPKLLKAHPQTQGFTLQQLERALNQMLGKGELRLAVIGSGNGRREVIVPADWPPLPDERDPITGQKKDPKS